MIWIICQYNVSCAMLGVICCDAVNKEKEQCDDFGNKKKNNE